MEFWSAVAIYVIPALLTLVGVFLTVVYKNRPKKKDRVELFFERYDKDAATNRKDIKDLRDRLATTEEKLDRALQSLEDKNDRIKVLEAEVKDGNRKYANLLRRFNTLKEKYDKKIQAEKVV